MPPPTCRPRPGQDTSSSQYTVPPTTPTTTVAPSAVFGSGAPTTTTVPSSSGANPFLSGTNPYLGSRQGQEREEGADDRRHRSAAPLVAAPAIIHARDPGGRATPAPAPVEPAAPTAPALPAPLAPIDPITTLVTPPPPAPLVTGAAAFVDSALVTWKPPAGTTATGYDVFVGFGPGLEFPVALNGANPVVGNSYLVTGLTAGHTYYFTVKARTAGVSSTASNEVSATPFNAYTPLGTPGRSGHLHGLHG